MFAARVVTHPGDLGRRKSGAISNALGAALMLLILCGCAPLTPREAAEASPLGVETSDASRIGLGFLEKKRTYEVRGELDGDVFNAREMRLKKDDREVALKGTVAEAPEGNRLLISGVEFVIAEETKFERAGAGDASITDLKAGTWVKVESIQRDQDLVLRKVSIRERKDGELEELEGPATEVRRSANRLVIGNIEVRYSAATPFLWDVKGEEPPPMEARRFEPAPRQKDGIARVRHLDVDESRPTNQFSPFDGLTIGGDLKYDMEWRNNHDLQDIQERDRLIHEAGISLEFSAAITNHLYAFLKLNGGVTLVHFDQERDLEESNPGEINEAWILLEDWPIEGVALQIGRQDIDDRHREFVTDDQLDAVRAWIHAGIGVLELSLSEKIFQTDPENKHVVNAMAGFRMEPWLDQHFLIYSIFRRQGANLDIDRWHFGVSHEGEWQGFLWWLDLAYTKGEEEDQKVEGVAVDGIVAYTFEDLSFEPSILAGFAWASGDRDPTSGTNHTFRQTGLNDNQDRLTGVVSFRYLGEVARFDLENLVVLTLGVDTRPIKNTSLGLYLHSYRQEEQSAIIPRTRLRLTPTGESRDLGTGLDLVLGIHSFYPMRFQIVLGYFQPGAAFGPDADDAWNLTFEARYVF